MNEHTFYSQAALSALVFFISKTFSNTISSEGTKEDIEICLASIVPLQAQPLSTLQELSVTENKFHRHKVSNELKAAVQKLIAALNGETPQE